jgi:hypothetical protein
MSDQPHEILLDSVSYFRLAYSIRPLLRGSIGTDPRYTLFVLPALDDEFRSSARLQHKFGWVNDNEFKEDRAAKRYKLSRKPDEQAHKAVNYLARYADDEELNVSLEDLKALAVGYVKSIPVVTDDINMAKVAEAHDIACWSTIKLLKLMHSSGKIDDAKVKEILEYLQCENDLPAPLTRLREVFKEYFGTDCPI